MKILALESSAKAASAAVCQDGQLVAQYMQCSGLTHSRTLLSMAEDMLHNLDMTIRDIDTVAVAIGPGSFTGIRIGIAAAKGIAWAAEKPACGVSTLHAMAYHMADREGIICPLMDARRGQVYNALFEAKNGKLTRLKEDRAIELSKLIEESKNTKKKYFLVGDGARMCYNKFLEAGIDASLAPDMLIYQSAWGVAAAAYGMETCSPDDLVPNYLRLSQAERERLERENKL